ncbi:hypothetical protein D3C78_1490660 [compost metagenome]
MPVPRTAAPAGNSTSAPCSIKDKLKIEKAKALRPDKVKPSFRRVKHQSDYSKSYLLGIENTLWQLVTLLSLSSL